jgi:hypothetical protein
VSTIDPAEFEEGGMLYRGTGMHIEEDTRPFDPAIHPPGSAKWAEHQATLDAEGDEDRFTKSLRKAKSKIDAANAAIVKEAELHRQEVAKEAAKKQSDLETLLGLMEETEARRVRMEAYLRALDAAIGTQWERQLFADTLCLRIARYMIDRRAD